MVYKYFADMGVMFSNMRRVLKDGAPFVLVVGGNKTTLGGQTYTVDTPTMLARIAEQRGFAVRQIRPLDTYHRFDIHHANSIRTEKMLVLEAERHVH